MAKKPTRFRNLAAVPQTGKTPSPVRPVGKSKDPNYAPLFAYVPVELHGRLKMRTMLEKREISEVITELVTDYMANWSIPKG